MTKNEDKKFCWLKKQNVHHMSSQKCQQEIWANAHEMRKSL